MGQTVQEIWEQAKARLAEEIPPPSFAAWFSDATPKGHRSGQFRA